MAQGRLSYVESLQRLWKLGYLAPEVSPVMSQHVPQADDEEPLGLQFFRTRIGDGDNLGGLNLPRTFFGRSEVCDVSFRNTDLSESNLCWNDFSDVDFTEASLAGADLRASHYVRVNFSRADLMGADMRHAEFEACVFENAALDDAIVARKQAGRMALTPAQRAVIDWRDEDGDEPQGG